MAAINVETPEVHRRLRDHLELPYTLLSDDAIRRLPAAGFRADVDLTGQRQSFSNLELASVISASGRNEARSKPRACSFCSHWASFQSVLRPGTALA